MYIYKVKGGYNEFREFKEFSEFRNISLNSRISLNYLISLFTFHLSPFSFHIFRSTTLFLVRSGQIWL